MNSPRVSVLFWAILELAIGAGLFLVPAQLTDLLGVAEPIEVWIRVVGVAAVGLGVIYLSSTFADSRWFYRASVIERGVAALMLAFLAMIEGPWQLWIFAVVAALGATWTAIALRNTRPGAAGADGADADLSDLA